MKLPEWLEQEQAPSAKSQGREHFLVRNRSSLQAIFESFSTRVGNFSYFSPHPTSFFLATVFVVLGLSLSQSLVFFWVFALILGALSASLPDEHLRNILKKTILLSILPLLVYLPALYLGMGHIIFLVRIPLILLAVSLYAEVSSMADFIQALKQLHFPDVVLLQLDITAKYIFIFSQFLMDILKAVEVRSNGTNLKFQVGTNIWGILYLKAVQFGQDLQKAMEARGFVGHYHATQKKLSWKDYLLLVGLVLLIIVLL